MFQKILRIAALLLLSHAALPAQSPGPQTASAPEVDTNLLTQETQRMDQRKDQLGIFWWIPLDYWIASATSTGMSQVEARKTFGPLGDYTMFVVGVGSTGIGNINWMSEAEVRKNVVLRDQAGTIYKPLEKVSGDADGITAILKPVFKNILGPMAEGLHVLYFPAKDSAGKDIADPRRNGEFSLDVATLMGPGTSTYTWRLPLTSMLPPKYCPVGKEKVDANWKYCPWHGNKLESEAAPAKAPTPAKP